MLEAGTGVVLPWRVAPGVIPLVKVPVTCTQCPSLKKQFDPWNSRYSEGNANKQSGLATCQIVLVLSLLQFCVLDQSTAHILYTDAGRCCINLHEQFRQWRKFDLTIFPIHHFPSVIVVHAIRQMDNAHWLSLQECFAMKVPSSPCVAVRPSCHAFRMSKIRFAQ